MKLKNLIITIILFFGISALYAQQWTQIGDPINGDAENDQSGFKVSLSGDGTTVAVAAIEHDRDGFNLSDDAGQVKVYKNINGNWIQIGQDIIGEQPNEDMGMSLGLNLDGTVLAVGAPYYDYDDNLTSGHVKIFKYNNGNWEQIGEDIKGSTLDELCGYSLDLNSDGDVIAIGSKANAFYAFAGVRVYKNFSGKWEKLGSDLLGSQGDLGLSVSLNSKGDIVAMGGIYDSEIKGYVEIYQYNKDENLWKIIGKPIDGKNPKDESGWSISLNSDGDIIAIGAPGNDDNGEESGHTRILKNNSGTWTQLGSDINGEFHKYSGRSVSLSADGTIVAIGSAVTVEANNEKDNVSIYQYKSDNWNLLGDKIYEEEANSSFGFSVSLSANGYVIAVGATFANTNQSGQTRIYKYDGSLSVENVSFANIIVYPNPAINTLYLSYDKATIFDQKSIWLEIYSATGQKVKVIDHLTDKIDISGLGKGIYLISFITDKGTTTRKFAVAR